MKIFKAKGLAFSSALLLALMLGSFSLQAQTNLEIFGQNRVQYRKFKWKYYDTKHFRIYHYDRAGREMAEYVAEQVENDIAIIESKMGGSFPKRFNIILYNSYDEYRQTNVGRKNESQLRDIPAGTVNLVGDKLVVYFTGEHKDLRRQTRAGMSRVIMEKMLFGDSFKDVVRNAVLTSLPDWTVYGFISYIVDGWDTEANSKWKGMVEMYPNKGFHDLSEKNPELAGKAFWKYISDKYGENNMKNMVYTIQLKSSLNNGLQATMGMKAKQAYDSVMTFYKNMYALDMQQRQLPDSTTALIEIDVPDDGTVLRDIRVAPRGADVAYVTWKDGEYKVYIQKTKQQQTKAVVLSGGFKDYNETPDQDYPLITWSNNGYKLAVLYRVGLETRLRIYNSLKAVVENYVIPPNRFDRVLSMTFMEDDGKLIFSAIKKGNTDLYEFKIRGKRMTNITDDEWDDVEPWYVSGGTRRGVLFLSNRPKPNTDVPMAVNELPTGPMNVFFYNTTTESKELIQMSRLEKGDARQPIQYGSENYAYLYDENGIQNQYIILMNRGAGNKDSAYSVPVTNFHSNIINHQYNAATNKIANVIREGGKYKVYFEPINVPDPNAPRLELPQTVLSKSESKKGSVLNNKQVTPKPILKKGNVFQSQFDTEEEEKDETNTTNTNNTDAEDQSTDTGIGLNNTDEVDSSYVNMRSYKYRLSFQPDYFSVKLDNSILFNRYQPAAQNGNSFDNPPLGGLISVSLDDVLEDHRVTGGFRVPISFDGTTYFLQYENFKTRVDWSVLYLRSHSRRQYNVAYFDQNGSFIDTSNQTGKIVSNIVTGTASYPFSRRSSIRMHLGFRNDRLTYKAGDTLSLSIDPEQRSTSWIISRAEYVFDNTINPITNIWNGTRYKVYGEYFYGLNSNGGFYNIGTDIRYYKKIYKNCIWAIRAASAHSRGDQKVLYFLGGVDNWLNAEYNTNTPTRGGEEYAFQTVANNLRGYSRNTWNGNTFALINTEVRLPLVTTFAKKPIQSSVLRSLQAVAFFDIGSAWMGLWPTDANVANNRTFIDQNHPQFTPVTLVIDDNSKGLGVGYGLGARTMAFGYFLRLDYAFNIERESMLHISIGTDF